NQCDNQAGHTNGTPFLDVGVGAGGSSGDPTSWSTIQSVDVLTLFKEWRHLMPVLPGHRLPVFFGMAPPPLA
uniref:Uncharacterized protein n=1 Tax=Romanomermis culicivorax TaxID=13658 RepID=A0A915IKI9_ROMCU